MAAVEIEPVSPAKTTSEQCGDQPEPKMELSSISLALSTPSTSDLVEANEGGSSTLTVGQIPMIGF